MPMHMTWKKIMTGALAFSIAAGSGTMALTTSPAIVSAEQMRATKFQDVEGGHWAEKHIAKLALQGIITGYKMDDETFTFEPGKSVSQQEAVLMAIRFAGLYDYVDRSTQVVFGDSFKVSEFYIPIIELAFREGLLDKKEEFELAVADPESEWGKKPASREWVTKLIVKAIGEQNAAEDLMQVPSAFHDAGAIDDRYLGYVNAAVEMGLVTGKTPVRFDPDAPVNRASLATLFSRAQGQYPVAFENQHEGVVTSYTGDTITIYEDGEETTFSMDMYTNYFHYQSDSPVDLGSILEYGDIMIIEEEGVARYVEVQGDVQHIETIEGTFERYNADDQQIYVWQGNDYLKVNYYDGILIEDTEGMPLTIEDLRSDAKLSILRDNFREQPVALKIVTEAPPETTTVEGDLLQVNAGLITIQSDGKPMAYYMAPNAPIQIEGLSGANVDDLVIKEDQLQLTLNLEEQVVGVKVLNRQVETLAGVEIEGYNEDRNYITIYDYTNNKSQLLTLTDKTRYNYLGTKLDKQGAMSFIAQNKNVIIRYTDGNVVSIEFVTSYTGTIYEIDTKNKRITIQLQDGELVKVPYLSEIAVSTIIRPLSSHLDLRIGDTVTLNMRMDKVEVTLIQLHEQMQYEIVSIDSVKKTIKVKNATVKSDDLRVDKVELLKADGSKALLKDLKVGSWITVDFVGDNPIKIQANSSNSNG
ncbi:S-layer homology domain-containing protein [Paenibacillus chungangensis]|uniref:S-layer homology domain-containing protein n=1 Tax=Paenibacillus chungangensis TaxID=696535 RepID=A0ABW3HN64_9BACL